ncbi:MULTISPECIES: 3-isopropylmalate dehydratase large subunit [Bradyrhizobium]|uniref:3-isopropylmalate dehydratase large subunit n=3 Tax=Bradyrhizobium TaxID=374 RepID=A0A410VI92_9BRAD|nr:MULTISPECIES: 3-isopropylmalate dehydratase large subunit [Bradyrhizobium]MCG2628251.1 3-isopropylmalate dehydratase large subunit [Bradyrhizobium zhengyangense]MCG2643370.1 3-isopropylmalate dehydratase large subunit [Bradyrhizobium zhengyangense]MCG2670316.1 3-isopropylmalate dehydratase large subunit [Bradyrhizobium zhengyangense]MDN4985950.1 3-isopropylmalate dehydratase large subunit [Bradyrhizobium sp. WYCCWR 13022]MDN5002670.1 3-isopropylmalate dehydratase large subunit [Bradyrhizobi
MANSETLFDKIWLSHVIREIEDGVFLLHVDRHMVHECTSAAAFEGLKRAGRKTRNPELTYAVVDHILSTAKGRTGETFAGGREFVQLLRENCQAHKIELIDVDDPRQGIVHVIAPELGIVLPGTTLVCGDSHTATCGGLGCWAWGIGTSEVEHVLATQTIVQRRPKRMRINFEGKLNRGVYAKDLILRLIGQIGVAAGRGYAVEYAGSVIRSLSIEERQTICNMSIEFGARAGLIAADDVTFEYLHDLPYSPKGEMWEQSLAYWRSLPTDPEAVFDREVDVDCTSIGPQVTWGTTPEDVGSVSDPIPDPAAVNDLARRAAMDRSLTYLGLEAGQSLEGLTVDVAFIGSCTNSRLSDIEAAAEVVRGRKVASHVRALVVPGSAQVKHAAESLGLDKVFLEAGFEWREAGCSMCVAINDDFVGPGKRCISTSNRNFEGRQGQKSRTHLASPASVAAAAIAGAVTDVRRYLT